MFYRIDSLKMFCDLVRNKSFTKAARLNGVTQPAISIQVNSLERHFKLVLIERSKKVFRLTRDGEVVYEYGQQMLQTYESLRRKLRRLKPGMPRPSFAKATPPIDLNFHLPIAINGIKGSS